MESKVGGIFMIQDRQQFEALYVKDMGLLKSFYSSEVTWAGNVWEKLPEAEKQDPIVVKILAQRAKIKKAEATKGFFKRIFSRGGKGERSSLLEDDSIQMEAKIITKATKAVQKINKKIQQEENFLDGMGVKKEFIANSRYKQILDGIKTKFKDPAFTSAYKERNFKNLKAHFGDKVNSSVFKDYIEDTIKVDDIESIKRSIEDLREEQGKLASLQVK